MKRALAFVEAHGDELDRRRAAALCGEAPPAAAIELLEPPASVAAALEVLGVVDELRSWRAPVAEQAVAYAETAQREDGSWAGDLFATGMLAGFLGKTPWARKSRLDAAGAWLASRWSPDQVKGGAWQAIAAYAHFFANVEHELADAALQWCGRELDRGYRTRQFDAVRTARVLVWCDALALPGAKLGAQELAHAIRAEQGEDGGWGDVERTLAALAALRLFRAL